MSLSAKNIFAIGLSVLLVSISIQFASAVPTESSVVWGNPVTINWEIAGIVDNPTCEGSTLYPPQDDGIRTFWNDPAPKAVDAATGRGSHRFDRVLAPPRAEPYIFSCTHRNADGNIDATGTAELTVTCPSATPYWNGSQCVSCPANTTWNPATKVCDATSGGSCSYDSRTQGQLKWGANDACKAALDYNTGTVPNTGTATAPNISSDYSNDSYLKYRCNNGAWEPVDSKCAPTCGSAADGRTFSSPPTENLCHSGDTASQAVLAAGLTPPQYLWRCTANGWIEFCRAGVTGTTDTCRDGSPIPANGICPGGTTCSDGTPIPADGICPGGTTCSDGTPIPANGICPGGGGTTYSCVNNQCVATAGGTYTSSNCNNACGVGGGCVGSNCPCTEPANCPTSFCGTAVHDQFLRSALTETDGRLCSSGGTYSPGSFTTNTTGAPKYTWRCSSPSGVINDCWAYQVEDGVCGTNPNPATRQRLCDPGDAINFRETSGEWIWDCNGRGWGSTNATNCRQARTSCTPSRICFGGNITNGCGVTIQVCQFGCHSSPTVDCNTSSAVSAVDFSVQPTLVARGKTTRVFWNIQNSICTVTEPGTRTAPYPREWKTPTCGDSHIQARACVNGTRENFDDDNPGFWTWDCRGVGALASTLTLTRCLEYKPQCRYDTVTHQTNQCAHGVSRDTGDSDEYYIWECRDRGQTTFVECQYHKPIDGGLSICSPGCGETCVDQCDSPPPQYGGRDCTGALRRIGDPCPPPPPAGSGLSVADIRKIVTENSALGAKGIAAELIERGVTREEVKVAYPGDENAATIDNAYNAASGN